MAVFNEDAAVAEKEEEEEEEDSRSFLSVSASILLADTALSAPSLVV
jgi:hypothetical protein